MMAVALTAIMASGMAVALTTIMYTGSAEAQAGGGAAEAQGGGGMVDHSVYDGLLKKYVDDRGMIDYRTWKARDVGTLDGYLEMIKSVDPGALKDRNEVFAYWINTYNALTIRGCCTSIPPPASGITSACSGTASGRTTRSTSRARNTRWMTSSTTSCARWTSPWSISPSCAPP